MNSGCKKREEEKKKNTHKMCSVDGFGCIYAANHTDLFFRR